MFPSLYPLLSILNFSSSGPRLHLSAALGIVHHFFSLSEPATLRRASWSSAASSTNTRNEAIIDQHISHPSSPRMSFSIPCSQPLTLTSSFNPEEISSTQGFSGQESGTSGSQHSLQPPRSRPGYASMFTSGAGDTCCPFDGIVASSRSTSTALTGLGTDPHKYRVIGDHARNGGAFSSNTDLGIDQHSYRIINNPTAWSGGTLPTIKDVFGVATSLDAGLDNYYDPLRSDGAFPSIAAVPRNASCLGTDTHDCRTTNGPVWSDGALPSITSDVGNATSFDTNLHNYRRISDPAWIQELYCFQHPIERCLQIHDSELGHLQQGAHSECDFSRSLSPEDVHQGQESMPPEIIRMYSQSSQHCMQCEQQQLQVQGQEALPSAVSSTDHTDTWCLFELPYCYSPPPNIPHRLDMTIATRSETSCATTVPSSRSSLPNIFAESRVRTPDLSGEKYTATRPPSIVWDHSQGTSPQQKYHTAIPDYTCWCMQQPTGTGPHPNTQDLLPSCNAPHALLPKASSLIPSHPTQPADEDHPIRSEDDAEEAHVIAAVILQNAVSVTRRAIRACQSADMYVQMAWDIFLRGALTKVEQEVLSMGHLDLSDVAVPRPTASLKPPQTSHEGPSRQDMKDPQPLVPVSDNLELLILSAILFDEGQSILGGAIDGIECYDRGVKASACTGAAMGQVEEKDAMVPLTEELAEKVQKNVKVAMDRMLQLSEYSWQVDRRARQACEQLFLTMQAQQQQQQHEQLWQEKHQPEVYQHKQHPRREDHYQLA